MKSLTTSQLSDLLDMEESKIRTTINRLKEKGLVEETGLYVDRYKIFRISSKISNIPLLLGMLMNVKSVKAVALFSNEGIPIASILPNKSSDARYAKLTLALINLSQRACNETKKGRLTTMYIEGEEGNLLLINFDPDYILTISLDNTINKGQFFTQQYDKIDLIRVTIAEMPYT